ncbi:hypothetical protein [uncultured Marinobacter sp.]|uniref:hypothetical protein n=1 Tax=uncultured Marinobacter sp. TaxID=187379 RepID=UPI0026149810|nr:hypothetical protein [uncultured Marinobacter sp.]
MSHFSVNLNRCQVPVYYHRWIALIFSAIALFVLINYIGLASSPVIRSDAWSFLSSLGGKWTSEGFSFSDLFYKRSISDHAQPLNKMLFYINLKNLGLDFRYEAFIGFLGVAVFVFIALIFYSFSERSQLGNGSLLSLLGAIAVITSLNSTNIYTWPLVSFGIIYPLLSAISAVAIFHYIQNGKPFFLSVPFVAIFLMGDSRSIVFWVALMACLVVTAYHFNGCQRKRSLYTAISGSLTLLLFYVLVNFKFIFQQKVGEAPDALDSPNIVPFIDYFEAIRIVFSSSLIHRKHYADLGNLGYLFSWIVAFVVLGFYVRFLLLSFIKRERLSMPRMALLFVIMYATVATCAVFFGRVSEKGVEYLNQPRYVIVYQLIPFALLLDLALSIERPRASVSRIDVAKWVAGLVGVACICLSVYFSVTAYRVFPWISKHQDYVVKVIGYLSDHPDANVASYRRQLGPLSAMDKSERIAVIDLLKKKKLNLFSPKFQWKYRLFPYSYKVDDRFVLDPN